MWVSEKNEECSAKKNSEYISRDVDFLKVSIKLYDLTKEMKVAMNYESSIYPEIIEDFITDFELGVARIRNVGLFLEMVLTKG